MIPCVEWQGPRYPNGYGRRRFRGRWIGAHRAAYMEAHGLESLPYSVKVRHSCDNPPCVESAHLLSGTQKDNIGDAVARGRMARRGRLPQTKLADADVVEIRTRFGSPLKYCRGNVTMQTLADEYGVALATVAYALGRVAR